MKENNKFVETIKQFYRPIGTFADYIPCSAFVMFSVAVLGQLVGLGISGSIFPKEGLTPEMSIFKLYFDMIGVWPVVLLFLLLPKNRPILKTLTTKMKGNTLKWILLGTLIGFAMNSFCAVMSILFRDIALSFNGFDLKWFLLLFFAVFIQSGSEELVCRCYIYQKLRRRYRSPWVAVIVNSVVFGAMHIPNPGANFVGIAQCMLFGLLTSVLIWKYNSLWGAMFVHTAWNFTQNIFFGLPNSGVVSPYSVFRLEAASAGLFFDPGFGIEGGPLVLLMLALVTAALLYYAEKKGLQEQDIWKETEEAYLTAHAAEENA